jgi:hypothetical protein
LIFLFQFLKKTAPSERLRFGSCESERERAVCCENMSDEINLELQRLIDRFGRDEADEDAPEELPDGEPADSATTGEIDAELLQEIAGYWQRADEAAQIEADARAARELDELVERFRNEPDL